MRRVKTPEGTTGETKSALKGKLNFAILGNAFVAATELTAGVLGNSSALVSDALHQSDDILSYGMKRVAANRPSNPKNLLMWRLGAASTVILASFGVAARAVYEIAENQDPQSNESVLDVDTAVGAIAVHLAIAGKVLVRPDKSALGGDTQWHAVSDLAATSFAVSGVLLNGVIHNADPITTIAGVVINTLAQARNIQHAINDYSTNA